MISPREFKNKISNGWVEIDNIMYSYDKGNDIMYMRILGMLHVSNKTLYELYWRYNSND